MKQYCTLWTIGTFVVFARILYGATPDVINKEQTNSYTVARINALNAQGIAQGSNSASHLTNNIVVDGAIKTFLQIKKELAAHRVTVRFVDGKYVDVSASVINGFVLDTEDQMHLANLNYLQDAYCAKLQPDQLVPGPVNAMMEDYKQRLKQHGIFLRFDDPIFVVSSVNTNAVTK